MTSHDSNSVENKGQMSLDIVAHRQHRFYKKTNAYANNVSTIIPRITTRVIGKIDYVIWWLIEGA